MNYRNRIKIFISITFLFGQIIWPKEYIQQFCSISNHLEAAVIEVTSTADTTSSGSLREAIDTATSGDTIIFNATVTTIFLNSTLTVSINNLTITGTKDATGNNGPGVELTPTVADTVINALVINADNVVIRGLAVYSFGQGGINIDGNGNSVLGCHLGTNITGTIDMGNGDSGLKILGGNSNVIGGDINNTAQRNVICGNLYGLTVSGTNNTIQGNYIGVDLTGTTPLGNSLRGLLLIGSNNTIGGGTSSSANIIADSGYGIEIASDSDLIQGNYIGTGRAGTEDLGHDFEALTYSFGSGRSKVINNVMAFNDTGGIGINSIMITSTGNKFSQNSIYDNGGLGIDIGDDGVTANDFDDTDTGPNSYVNFPVVSQARVDTSGNLIVTGTLDIGGAETTATIEVFIADNNPANNDDHGEGKTYLGSTMPIDNVIGDWSITITGSGVVVGDLITADVTDSAGNTSEFSLNVTVTLDTDGDGILDSADNCDSVANADQTNTDGDSEGDACDNDDDNDGVSDNSDAFPLDSAESLDTDNDGLGNNSDIDDDGDRVKDTIENAVGSNALDPNNTPHRLHVVYFKNDINAATLMIINNHDSSVVIAYEIYGADGTFAINGTRTIAAHALTDINMLDSNIKQALGSQAHGNIALYYVGDARDIPANMFLLYADEGWRSIPAVHIDSLTSNVISAVWMISKEGVATVRYTNTSESLITANLRAYNKNGGFISNDSVSITAHSTSLWSLPVDYRRGHVEMELISGNPGDLIANLITTDNKRGNSEHLFVDAAMQTSSLNISKGDNMGYKVTPILLKSKVGGANSKAHLVLSNLSNEDIVVYPILLIKKGKIKLNKKSIPALGTIKRKIHGFTSDNVLGVRMYHEGGGSAVIGNVYTTIGNTAKMGISYPLSDANPLDLVADPIQYNQGFNSTGFKVKVLLQNLSATERNVVLIGYGQDGNLLATESLMLKGKKVKSVNFNKLISNQQTSGYVALSHDGVSGDIKACLIMTNRSSGDAIVIPFIDRESHLK